MCISQKYHSFGDAIGSSTVNKENLYLMTGFHDKEYDLSENRYE